MPRTMGMRRLAATARWLQAFDVSIILPGNATKNTCFIHVPYRHKILRGYVGYSAAAVVGSLTLRLARAATGVDWSASGETVAKSIVLADSAGLCGASEFIVLPGVTFPAATVVPPESGAADTLYFLRMTGTNAGDLLKTPALNICVEPIPRAAL